MRLVIDTNVIVSGLYSLDSPPGRLLEAASERRIDLCAPENVRVELDRVLRRVLDYGDREVAATLSALPIEWIEEEVYRQDLPFALGVLRDPDDAPILACGAALGCDIVSGDRDLQDARQKRVKVWKPAEVARRG